VLKFSRNVVVGVERRDDVTLRAHGFQEDNFHTLSLDVDVRLPDFKVSSIDGEFKRATYNECRMAVPKLQNAVGLCIKEEDFSARIRRVVGGEGCRYFADLLLNCCGAIEVEATYGEWRELKQEKVTRDEFRKRLLKRMPDIREKCLAYSRGD
jgi:hypothetical protein